jgi:septum site-determining protein MinC
VSDSLVSIKGMRDGLLIVLDEHYTWETTEAALVEVLQARRDFFRGAKVAVQVGDRVLERDEIRRLKDKLAEHDVTLMAVLGQSPETLRSARRLDLETDFTDTPPPPAESKGELPPIDSDVRGESAVVIKQTLRSGNVVRHIGHVIVIGDVNPGAQIIAGGDVLIWGRLRGIVHAGASGETDAIVGALDMRPQQLRIANHVAVAPDTNTPRSHAEVAFVKDGQIMAEEWGSQ